MSYKNKKNFKLLLFLTLCTVTFSTENSKKIVRKQKKLIQKNWYVTMK